MDREKTLEEIRQHWEEAGRAATTSDGAMSPTSRDPFLADLERANILEFLPRQGGVLEIGCGDGIHTVHYARHVERLEGLELSESLARLARERAGHAGIANLTVTVGSVLDLKAHYGGRAFPSLISQRCLINLPTWEHQKEALEQCAGVLEPGGLLLLSEGFTGELERLNSVRSAVGLEEIRVVEYNRNFVREDFESFVARFFDVLTLRDYGLYLLLSRVLHPLAVEPTPPRHDSAINQAAAKLARALKVEELRPYSYNLFYVLRRKPR